MTVMTRLSFQFLYRTHDPIENHVVYNIRKDIANMMRDCEFGEVLEQDESKFINEYAIPTTDDLFIPENDLFISFAFELPLRHGNLARLLVEEIPQFYRHINDDYHMQLITRYFIM